MSDEIVKTPTGGVPPNGSKSPVPARCPVCSTEVPQGRDRCPGCGKRLAATDLCPHCNNPSPAVPYFSRSGPGCLVTMLYGLGGLPGLAFRRAHENELVCELCGGHRGFTSGPPLLTEDESSRGGMPPDQAVLRAAQIDAMGAGRSRALKIFAGAFGLLAALCLAGAIATDSGWVTLLAVVGLLGSSLAAAGLFVAGRGLGERYRREAEATRMRALADLVREHAGVLSLDEAAAGLGLPPAQVEPLLSPLVDGTNVKLEVSDEGHLIYQFVRWVPGYGKLIESREKETTAPS